MSIHSLSTVVAAAVATDGTIVFAYPAGVTSANVAAGGEVLGVRGLQNVLAQASDTFTVAYSGSITVTYKDLTSIPANTTVELQIKSVDAATATSNEPAATATYRGAVKQMPVQAASVAADTAAMVVDFNALLTKLKNAGIMSAS
jgi:hypothetical protein